MITIDDIVSQIAAETNLDKDTVSCICKHPFICTMQIMKDEDDYRDILFNKLFKFKLKSRYKLNKNSKYAHK